jgi:hypothetical protein
MCKALPIADGELYRQPPGLANSNLPRGHPDRGIGQARGGIEKARIVGGSDNGGGSGTLCQYCPNALEIQGFSACAALVDYMMMYNSSRRRQVVGDIFSRAPLVPGSFSGLALPQKAVPLWGVVGLRDQGSSQRQRSRLRSSWKSDLHSILAPFLERTPRKSP